MALLSTNGSPGSSSSADSNAPGAELQPVVPGADIFYPDVESRPGAYLANLQNFESGGNPNAVNMKSSAVGPYQFTNDTWNDVWSRSLKDRGIVNDPTDPTAAALGADAYTKENAATLTKALGRTPTDSELAMAHVFGPMGATRLLEGNLYQPATDFASPQVVSANSLLFYNADGTSKTVGELKGLFDRHFGTGNTALAGPVEAPQALMGAGQALQMARALPERSALPGRFRDGETVSRHGREDAPDGLFHRGRLRYPRFTGIPSRRSVDWWREEGGGAALYDLRCPSPRRAGCWWSSGLPEPRSNFRRQCPGSTDHKFRHPGDAEWQFRLGRYKRTEYLRHWPEPAAEIFTGEAGSRARR